MSFTVDGDVEDNQMEAENIIKKIKRLQMDGLNKK